MRWLARRFGFGLAFSGVAIGLAVAVTAIWGPIYGVWDWPVVAGILLGLGAMGFALLEEAVRPGNPYRHLNPLYGLQDVHGAGRLDSGGSGWIWNALPPVVVAGVVNVVF
jgi:hypothetical protein